MNVNGSPSSSAAGGERGVLMQGALPEVGTQIETMVGGARWRAHDRVREVEEERGSVIDEMCRMRVMMEDMMMMV